MKARLYTILLLLLFIAVSSATTGGTLVILAPTRSGVVVCADKRRWNQATGAVDDAVKIMRLNPRLVFAMSGQVEILRRQDLAPVYSVPTVVQAFFTPARMKDVDAQWDRLRTTLVESYAHYLAAGGSGWVDPASVGLEPREDDTIYCLLFVYLNPAGSVRVMKVAFHDAPQRKPGVSVEDLTADLHGMYAEGSTAVVKEIVRGKDPRFADLRADQLVKRVWLSRDPREVDPADAILAARRLIRYSSERYPLVSPTRTLVSASSLCGVMIEGKGFEWRDNRPVGRP